LSPSHHKTGIFLVFSALITFIVAGCETTIKTQRFDTPESINTKEKPSDRAIEVYLPLDNPPENIIQIGRIDIGDSGFTTNCDQMTVILQIKQRAREMGGDAVHIYKLTPPDFFSTCYRASANVLSFTRLESTGTGFYVDDKGTIITASHVISDAENITVQCSGEPPKPAQTIKQSKRNDIAIITTGEPSMHFLPLGSSSNIRLGSDVFTIGYPVVGLLGKEPKYTEGNISALSGFADDQSLIQISVPVQPGNSGGPVITDDGLVVGVVVSTAAIDAFYSKTKALPQNINWATKIDYAKLLLDSPAPSTHVIDDVISHAMRASCLITAN
jgi:S1-C subfamily serine protease